MAFDPKTLTHDEMMAMSPGEFVKIVRSISDKEVKELMAGEHRQVILDTIFERMPELYAGREGASRSVTHWTVTGGKGNGSDGDEDSYTVIFDGTTCTVAKGLDGDPRTTLTMGPVEFAKMVTKSGNPVKMVMMGKVKVKGDVGYAAKIPDFFDIPG